MDNNSFESLLDDPLRNFGLTSSVLPALEPSIQEIEHVLEVQLEAAQRVRKMTRHMRAEMASEYEQTLAQGTFSNRDGLEKWQKALGKQIRKIWKGKFQKEVASMISRLKDKHTDDMVTALRVLRVARGTLQAAVAVASILQSSADVHNNYSPRGNSQRPREDPFSDENDSLPSPRSPSSLPSKVTAASPRRRKANPQLMSNSGPLFDESIKQHLASLGLDNTLDKYSVSSSSSSGAATASANVKIEAAEQGVIDLAQRQIQERAALRRYVDDVSLAYRNEMELDLQRLQWRLVRVSSSMELLHRMLRPVETHRPSSSFSSSSRLSYNRSSSASRASIISASSSPVPSSSDMPISSSEHRSHSTGRISRSRAPEPQSGAEALAPLSSSINAVISPVAEAPKQHNKQAARPPSAKSISFSSSVYSQASSSTRPQSSASHVASTVGHQLATRFADDPDLMRILQQLHLGHSNSGLVGAN